MPRIEKIIEPNKEIKDLQDSLVSEFQDLLPNSEIELIGAMSIPMIGRPELDILIISKNIEEDSLVLVQEGYVQGPIVNGVSNLKKYIDAIEIGVQIHVPESKMIEIHRGIIKLLRENEELRLKYENFKRTLAGLTRDEYKKQKSAWMEQNILPLINF